MTAFTKNEGSGYSISLDGLSFKTLAEYLVTEYLVVPDNSANKQKKEILSFNMKK